MTDWSSTTDRPSVRVYGIATRNGEVLLVRARSRRSDGVAVWWLPGGGVDFLETPVDALTREFREETGLQVMSATLVDVMSDTWTRRNGDVAHAIRIIYRVAVDGDNILHEGDGSTDQARWFSNAELPSIELAPYAKIAIDRTNQTK